MCCGCRGRTGPNRGAGALHCGRPGVEDGPGVGPPRPAARSAGAGGPLESRPIARSATYTADFRHEFEAETVNLLRGRFLLFNGLLGALWAIMFLVQVVGVIRGLAGGGKAGGVDVTSAAAAAAAATQVGWRAIGAVVFTGVAVAVYGVSFGTVRRGRLSNKDTLKITYLLVIVDGALRIVMHAMGVPGGLGGLWGVLIAHVLASICLPWSPKQAVYPILTLIGLDAVLFVGTLLISGQGQWGDALLHFAFSPFIALPGTLICAVRHSRRLQVNKLRFLQRRYGEVRRELVDARRIHEALFPRPCIDGPLRFSYRYEPMRQIGGDYLYACFTGPIAVHPPAQGPRAAGRLNVVIMDVTGHGIPAALTVNRLHGELERVFAENPDIGPGEVLKLLNRYVHLTLASHSVYVTALCVRVDATHSVLEYASGGHPPAFLRAVDGTIQDLPSTAIVLGACADTDFHPEPRRLGFGPGDVLVAYTDGAIEARDRNGRMLSIQGFQRWMASTKPDPEIGWCATLLQQVEQYRHGPPADDTLIVEIARPVGS
ncbi:MAG: serine/threonine-protein phosphatase [Phycisphaerales bacterium]|nr:serine/threonine-protein phosphatase [Phycisphaerales bacterium]